MRKFILAIMLLYSSITWAQSWAAPGAVWHYTLQSMILTGYQQVTRVGDTTIGGRQYDKLDFFQYGYDQLTASFYSYHSMQYTRTDNAGTVFIYNDSVDYVLYDFNAQAGDSWVVCSPVNGFVPPCDTTTIVVDSVSSTVINNDTLRVLFTHPVRPFGNSVLFLGRIVEKIGCVSDMVPYSSCYYDGAFGDGLRCYSDSSGWAYQSPTWSEACDFTIGINEQQPIATDFSVLYNPTAASLEINSGSLQRGAQLRVYDAQGNLLLAETMESDAKATIPFTAPAGIYFVQLETNTVRLAKKFALLKP